MKINPSTRLRIDGERPSTSLGTSPESLDRARDGSRDGELVEPFIEGRSRTIKVAPSILSADFSCLAKEIKKVEAAGADMLHIDVMDGHFVPNITIGPVVVKHIRKVTKLPLDVHLMIEKPEKLSDAFVAAGSDMITIHIETISKSKLKILRHKLRRIRQESWRKKSKLKRKGIKLGISLNPDTPLAKIKNLLNLVDFVLVMSVNPGFSGQHFIPEALSKIKQLRSIYAGDIAVDGGINGKTAKDVINAGANILASGSYIFGAKNVRLAIERLRNAGARIHTDKITDTHG